MICNDQRDTAKVMEDAGIDCYLVERDTPTPVVAWEVKDKKAFRAQAHMAVRQIAEHKGWKDSMLYKPHSHDPCILHGL